MMKKTINVIYPKPYERVGTEFVVSGFIHKSLLKASTGYLDKRVLGSFLDINGVTFAGTFTAQAYPSLFSSINKKYSFSSKVQFSQSNISFISASQGRIILKLFTANDDFDFYLPLVVNGFDPKGGVDPKIEELHKNIYEKIKSYKIELHDYKNELEKINNSRVLNHEILEGIFSILEDSKDNFEIIIESEEDKLEKNLRIKFETAIRWGDKPFPNIGVAVGEMYGFDFHVYNNDHDPVHFHAVHRGKGIDVRFSFPDINLLNYKGKSNTIGKKEIEMIRGYFKITENFQKLNSEFKKRKAVTF